MGFAKYCLIGFCLINTGCCLSRAHAECKQVYYIDLGTGGTVREYGHKDQEDPVGIWTTGVEYCDFAVEYFHSSSLADGLGGHQDDVNILYVRYRLRLSN